ncbi:MAG: DUF3592 domain-containing protein [Oscillospiraceae bacterium]|nr:DUF3592 domain-containing protein [Oscillospiraceae bacterium]
MENRSLEDRTRSAGAVALGWVGIIFLSIGLIFLLIGAFVYDREQAQTKGYEKAVGVITGFQKSGYPGYPYVTYEASGKTYRTLLGFYSSTMKVGDEVKILYDPASPTHAIYGGMFSLFLPLMFMGLGGFFALLGGIFLLLRRRLRENAPGPWEG